MKKELDKAVFSEFFEKPIMFQKAGFTAAKSSMPIPTVQYIKNMPNLLEKYPGIHKMMKSIEQLPNFAKWIARTARPN